MKPSRFRFGPGFLVAAAFIGPGTITTATMAGTRFGFTLLWAVAFSTIATMILQEMSSRLGLVTRKSLGEVLRTSFTHRLPQTFVPLLILLAIVFGNGAFEMGNLLGAAMGVEVLTGWSPRAGALLTAFAAATLLVLGSYSAIERLMTALVGLMGAAFIVTATMVAPDFPELLAGLFIPGVPAESHVTIIALIGTTVVPYNLFLHASAVQSRWSHDLPLARALRESRTDSGVSIGLGGLITAAVVVTAAAHRESDAVAGAQDMARQLRPLLGPFAQTAFAIGLIAAGLTSAITAPLAAAYAAAGVFGWSADIKTARFRAVWAAIIVAGAVFAWFGHRPVSAIIFAQAANGILLPFVAIFLLLIMNKKSLLGSQVNGMVSNLIGGIVVLVATGLGAHQLLRLMGLVG